MSRRPPPISRWLAGLVVHSVDENVILGDLEETHAALGKRYGRTEANRWYRSQVLRSVPHFISRNLRWSMVMLKNYVRVSFRSFRKYAGYSLINLSGLTAGLTCVLLIGVYLGHELTYDRFHERSDRIQRVVLDLATPSSVNDLSTTPGALAGLLESRVADIEETVRLYRPEQISVETGTDVFREPNLFFSDASFPDIFTVDVERGAASGMLEAPGSAVLTTRAAERYFGTTDVVGERLTVGDSISVDIKAVVKPFPARSHFDFDVLISMQTWKRVMPAIDSRWSPHMFYTYALLTPGADVHKIEERLPAIVDDAVSLSGGYSFTFLFQPLTDLHLKSHRWGEPGTTSDMKTVIMFGLVAVIVLLVACVNFMNLTTARSSTRSREVGMRKVLGAHRIQLVGQFVGEAMTYALVSAVAAWGIAYAFFPVIKNLAIIQLSRSVLMEPVVFAALIGLAVTVGLAAGGYPALFMSAFRPLRVLRSSSGSTSGGTLVRKYMVVAQLVISVFMIVGTIVVMRQVHHMRSADPGFQKDQVIVLSGLSASEVATANRIRTEAEKLASVQAVTMSNSVPGRKTIGLSYSTPSMPEGESAGVSVLFTDSRFNDVYGVDVVAGREFSTLYADDSSQTFLLNRAAALEMGWTPQEAVGRELSMRGPGIVVGVLEDFHYESLHSAVEPLVLLSNPVAYGSAPLMLSVRLKKGEIQEAVTQLEAVWDRLVGDKTFDYFFMDDDFDRQYRADMRMARVFTLLGGLAVAIACLGLFGLAAMSAERKKKEIGIRKVLGASVTEIATSFTLEFLKLAGMAFVIAAPFTWMAARSWLDNFAYRIEPGLGVLLLAGLGLALLAGLTVSYQSVRAATSNPVDSLRSE